jgi:hypothetical protein
MASILKVYNSKTNFSYDLRYSANASKVGKGMNGYSKVSTVILRPKQETAANPEDRPLLYLQ